MIDSSRNAGYFINRVSQYSTAAHLNVVKTVEIIVRKIHRLWRLYLKVIQIVWFTGVSDA